MTLLRAAQNGYNFTKINTYLQGGEMMRLQGAEGSGRAATTLVQKGSLIYGLLKVHK
jgi:ABC-type transport system involved in cytochrome c biogenesis ATPase subunit